MEAYQPDLGGRHTSMLMGIISVDADFLESLERWEVLIRWYQTVDVVSGATKIVVLMKYAPAALRGALRTNASFMGSDYERVNKFMLTGCRAGQSITTSAKQPRPRAHQAGRSQWMLEPSTTKAGRARAKMAEERACRRGCLCWPGSRRCQRPLAWLVSSGLVPKAGVAGARAGGVASSGVFGIGRSAPRLLSVCWAWFPAVTAPCPPLEVVVVVGTVPGVPCRPRQPVQTSTRQTAGCAQGRSPASRGCHLSKLFSFLALLPSGWLSETWLSRQRARCPGSSRCQRRLGRLSTHWI